MMYLLTDLTPRPGEPIVIVRPGSPRAPIARPMTPPAPAPQDTTKTSPPAQDIAPETKTMTTTTSAPAPARTVNLYTRAPIGRDVPGAVSQDVGNGFRRVTVPARLAQQQRDNVAGYGHAMSEGEWRDYIALSTGQAPAPSQAPTSPAAPQDDDGLGARLASIGADARAAEARRPAAPAFSIADRVTFTPHDPRHDTLSGVVLDVLNGGEGYALIGTDPADAGHVVRVWHGKGRIERTAPETSATAPESKPAPRAVPNVCAAAIATAERSEAKPSPAPQDEAPAPRAFDPADLPEWERARIATTRWNARTLAAWLKARGFAPMSLADFARAICPPAPSDDADEDTDREGRHAVIIPAPSPSPAPAPAPQAKPAAPAAPAPARIYYRPAGEGKPAVRVKVLSNRRYKVDGISGKEFATLTGHVPASNYDVAPRSNAGLHACVFALLRAGYDVRQTTRFGDSQTTEDVSLVPSTDDVCTVDVSALDVADLPKRSRPETAPAPKTGTAKADTSTEDAPKTDAPAKTAAPAPADASPAVRTVAEWRTIRPNGSGGADYLVLRHGPVGYDYDARGCGGNLPSGLDDAGAIAWMERGPVARLRSDRPSLRRWDVVDGHLASPAPQAAPAPKMSDPIMTGRAHPVEASPAPEDHAAPAPSDDAERWPCGEKRRPVYTTTQAAKIIGVQTRNVSRWFDSGILGGYRVPGSQDRRIPHDKLITFLDRQGMTALRDTFPDDAARFEKPQDKPQAKEATAPAKPQDKPATAAPAPQAKPDEVIVETPICVSDLYTQHPDALVILRGGPRWCFSLARHFAEAREVFPALGRESETFTLGTFAPAVCALLSAGKTVIVIDSPTKTTSERVSLLSLAPAVVTPAPETPKPEDDAPPVKIARAELERVRREYPETIVIVRGDDRWSYADMSDMEAAKKTGAFVASRRGVNSFLIATLKPSVTALVKAGARVAIVEARPAAPVPEKKPEAKPAPEKKPESPVTPRPQEETTVKTTKTKATKADAPKDDASTKKPAPETCQGLADLFRIPSPAPKNRSKPAAKPAPAPAPRVEAKPAPKTAPAKAAKPASKPAPKAVEPAPAKPAKTSPATFTTEGKTRHELMTLLDIRWSQVTLNKMLTGQGFAVMPVADFKRLLLAALRAPEVKATTKRNDPAPAAPAPEKAKPAPEKKPAPQAKGSKPSKPAAAPEKAAKAKKAKPSTKPSPAPEKPAKPAPKAKDKPAPKATTKPAAKPQAKGAAKKASGDSVRVKIFRALADHGPLTRGGVIEAIGTKWIQNILKDEGARSEVDGSRNRIARKKAVIQDGAGRETVEVVYTLTATGRADLKAGRVDSNAAPDATNVDWPS